MEGLSPERLRILFVTPTFPPENGWGGIGTYVHHLAKGLVQLNSAVHVLCGVEEGGRRRTSRTVDGVVVHRHLTSSSYASMREEVKDCAAALVEAEGVQLLEVPEYGALGLSFQEQFPAHPVVVRLHGDSSLCAFGNGPYWRQSMKHVIGSLLQSDIHATQKAECRSVGLAHLVTAPTNWVARQAVRRGWIADPDRLRVIANPFSGLAASQSPLDESTRPTVLLLGRLDYLKGASLIPGIVRLVHRTYPETRFRIIGQSATRQPSFPFTGAQQLYSEWIMRELDPGARSAIEMIPGVPHADLAKYFPTDGVASFQSTFESFGYTHVETMASGIATVIASGGGAQELGIPGATFVAADRCPKAIASAICSLLSDRIARSQLGAAGKAYVESEFNHVKVAAKMRSLYTGVRKLEAAA